MPKSVMYRCPECNGKFRYLHMHNEIDDPLPSVCPLCGYDSDEEEVSYTKEIAAPFISKAADKSADYVYKAMEAASEHRAQQAAEELGVSASDVSDLKITDMKDNLREGDTSVVKVQPKFDDMRNPSFFSPTNAAEYARSTAVGPYAHAGANALSGVTAMHNRHSHQQIKAGEQGRF